MKPSSKIPTVGITRYAPSKKDSGIPEFFRVTAQDGEAFVEVDELAAFVGEGAEAGLDQSVEELLADPGVGGRSGVVEAFAAPEVHRADGSPGVVGGFSRVHGGEERTV
ncbi:MAG: hypothetical protein WCI05_11660 [Myxococcales bacterium]